MSQGLFLILHYQFRMIVLVIIFDFQNIEIKLQNTLLDHNAFTLTFMTKQKTQLKVKFQ